MAATREASAAPAEGLADKLRAFAGELKKPHPNITLGEQWGRDIIADELDALATDPATYTVAPVSPGSPLSEKTKPLLKALQNLDSRLRGHGPLTA